jgi:hypothetical protein
LILENKVFKKLKSSNNNFNKKIEKKGERFGSFLEPRQLGI